MTSPHLPSDAQRTAPLAQCTLSVNALAAVRVDELLARSEELGLRVSRTAAGVTLIDAGLDAPGSIAAGLLIGEICLGGLGRVRLQTTPTNGWPTWLNVSSAQPVLACLGSQYAGWGLAASKEDTGGRRFFALGSGPVRALAAKEPLFAELGYRDRCDRGVLVLEVDRVPPTVVLDKVLRDSGLAPEGLSVILTPTSSRAGTTQVVARVLEVALHKAHTLGFDLAHITEGTARAPLPAPVADGVLAMGRTNDAILYGGQVHLHVTGDAAAARDLAQRLPSTGSRDHGQRFADIFQAADRDFYRIDPALFAPAEVWVSHTESGQTFHAGARHMPLLLADWLAND